MPKSPEHTLTQDLFPQLLQFEAARRKLASTTEAARFIDEKTAKLTRLLRILTTHVFVTDTTSHAFMQKLVSVAQNKVPGVVALTLLGSRTNGMNLLRATITDNTHAPTDFDIGVVLQAGIKNKKLEQIGHKTSDILREQITSNYPVPNTSLCTHMNPDILHSPQLQSVENAEKMLSIFFEAANNPKQTLSLFSYLYPSYSQGVWQQHQTLISQALQNIKQKNPERYDLLTRQLGQSLQWRIKCHYHHFYYTKKHPKTSFSSSGNKDLDHIAVKTSVELIALLWETRAPLFMAALTKGKIPPFATLHLSELISTNFGSSEHSGITEARTQQPGATSKLRALLDRILKGF